MRKLAMMSVAALCLVTSSAFALSDKPYITKDDIDIASLLPSPPTGNLTGRPARSSDRQESAERT